jgi:uncharacterized protein (TIGR02453 family)
MTPPPRRPSTKPAAPTSPAAKPTTPARFVGFPDVGATFFRGLAANNERSYFLEHKAAYERDWVEPMTLLLAEVRAKLDRSYPDVELAEPKIFRLQRDVRFSKDKTPYKTNISARIPVARVGSTIEVPIALYVQLGEEPFVAAGLYGVSAAALPRLRQAIVSADQGKQLDLLLKKFSKAHPRAELSAIDVLKRIPRGFDESHPRADLLRYKGLAVSYPLFRDLDERARERLLHSSKLVDELVACGRDAAPLVRWLTFATA